MNISNTTIKVLSKTMGVMAVGVIGADVFKMGKRRAKEFIQEGEAKDTLRTYVGDSKMDFPSPMYAKMKEKSFQMYPHKLMNFFHAVKGFTSGLFEGIAHHSDIIGASIFVLCAKKKIGQVISASVLGCICAFNIIKNGTALMEKRDDFDQM